LILIIPLGRFLNLLTKQNYSFPLRFRAVPHPTAFLHDELFWANTRFAPTL
jgi:hypothetical protein